MSTPPPFPTQSAPATTQNRKGKGCLIILGVCATAICFLLAFGWIANLIHGKEFRSNKAGVLEEVRQIGAADGDLNRWDSMRIKYQAAANDADFDNALAAAKEKIANTMAKRKAEEAAAKAEVAKVMAEAEAAKLKAKQEADEAAAKAKAEDVPGNVKGIAAEVFGKDLRSVTVIPHEKGGWHIHANVFDASGSAGYLKRHILDFAKRCHPQGMKVSHFSVKYTAMFNDGLGNSSEGRLVDVELRQDIAARINWAGLDEVGADFDKMFSTDYVHRDLKKEWLEAKP